MSSWVQNLNAAQKARRKRTLAAIHISAAENLGGTGDWKQALRDVVRQITGGKTTSCKDCYLDELRAVLETIKGEPITEPKFRRRIEGGKGHSRDGCATMSQAQYVRHLSIQVSEAHPERGGGAFGDVLLLAKFGTADPTLMTPGERRGAINILKSYLRKGAASGTDG